MLFLTFVFIQPEIQKVMCFSHFTLNFLFVKTKNETIVYSRAQNSTYPYYETLCKWGDFEREKPPLKRY